MSKPKSHNNCGRANTHQRGRSLTWAAVVGIPWKWQASRWGDRVNLTYVGDAERFPDRNRKHCFRTSESIAVWGSKGLGRGGLSIRAAPCFYLIFSNEKVHLTLPDGINKQHSPRSILLEASIGNRPFQTQQAVPFSSSV